MIAQCNATNESVRKAVELAFAKYDKDHNGTLEFEECVLMGQEISKYHAYGMTEK
jgi:Ca2+-binding EF-hand superfamily protein